MYIIKRLIPLLLALVMAAGPLAGCGKTDEGGAGGADTTHENKEDAEVKDRKSRELDPGFTYEIEESVHKIAYTDKTGQEITLFGRLTVPTEAGKYPAVILSHGFNGHYTDFPTECVKWAARGYVCYTFDFCGAQANGQSSGRTEAEYTPYTMVEDLKAVIADIMKLDNVDPTQIFLFGGSQGGLVTALTAAEEDIKGEIAAVAMYFPAFNIPDDWRSSPIQNTPLMGYSIGAEFISSIRDLDPFAVIGSYPGDVCIVWGDKDALVARRYIDGAVAAYGADRVDLTILPGAGHGFGGAALTTATEKVLQFLEAHTYEAE